VKNKYFVVMSNLLKEGDSHLLPSKVTVTGVGEKYKENGEGV